MNVILVHPFGNPNAYNAALGLQETGQLASFHTCLFNPFNSKLRYHKSLKQAPISTHPVFESTRLVLSRIPKISKLARSQRFVDFIGERCDFDASHSIPKDLDAVYGYEDFTLHSFKRAKNIGAERIYELPAGFHASHKSFLEQAADREPGIRPFIQALREPETKIRRKEAEIALATQIICASSFTASTVPSSIEKATPVTIVPYGADCSLPGKQWGMCDERGPVKLIFVGRLDPGKGLHVLFAALNGIARHEYDLTLVGSWVPGFKAYLDNRYQVSYNELGQVPHKALHEIYKKHHALVFPSLFEGFGLVLLEAMAAGIPVITTERTGGPDILNEDSGSLVPAGDSIRLRQSIEHLLNNRSAIAPKGAAARLMAESITWSQYRSRLIAALASPVRDKKLEPACLPPC